VNPLSWINTLDKVNQQAHLGAMPVEFKRTTVNMLLANNPGFIFQELPALKNLIAFDKISFYSVLLGLNLSNIR
jgi:hypothetical protein